jgi:hypothetical protein
MPESELTLKEQINVRAQALEYALEVYKTSAYVNTTKAMLELATSLERWMLTGVDPDTKEKKDGK